MSKLFQIFVCLRKDESHTAGRRGWCVRNNPWRRAHARLRTAMWNGRYIKPAVQVLELYRHYSLRYHVSYDSRLTARVIFAAQSSCLGQRSGSRRHTPIDQRGCSSQLACAIPLPNRKPSSTQISSAWVPTRMTFQKAPSDYGGFACFPLAHCMSSIHFSFIVQRTFSKGAGHYHACSLCPIPHDKKKDQ